jgi:hypothetical protein
MLDPIIAGVFHRDIQGRLRGLKQGAEREGLLSELTGPAGTSES